MKASPGVYTNIVPLSSYVQEIPSSTGFICFFSDKGPDNTLIRSTRLQDFIRLYGNPNYDKYGYQYGGGHLVAYSFMQVSPNCYTMRLLPDDATNASAHFFLLLEKSFKLKALSGTCTLEFNNTTGVMTITFQVPSIGYNVNKIVLIDTSDPAVKLLIREDGLMAVITDGTRGNEDAIISLTNGNIAISNKNKIKVSGHGTIVIDPTQNPTNGNIYVYLDDPDMMVYNFSFSGSDLDDLQTQVNSFRINYVVNSFLFAIGNHISGDYEVKLRRPTLMEKYLVKPQLCVPNDLDNPTKWFVITVNVASNVPSIIATQIETNNYQIIENRQYQKKIGNNYYAMIYDEVSSKLLWREVTVQEPWNKVYASTAPSFSIFSKYRGYYYNNYRIEFEEIVNRGDLFSLTIYEKKGNQEVIVGNFYVSFDPYSLDNNGQSLYINDVIGKYSDDIKINLYEYTINNFVSYLKLNGKLIEVDAIIKDISEITEPGWYYLHKNTTLRTSSFRATFGNYLGNFILLRNDGNFYNNSLVKNKSADGVFHVNGEEKEYFITLANTAMNFNSENYASIFMDYNGVYLSGGSDGSLFTNNRINPAVATNLLVNAYLGNIDDKVTDTDFIWFDLIFDGGYPKDVKDAIVSLAHEIRRDCIAIIDNGDNRDAASALSAREKLYTYNSEYTAIYEPYIQIYDDFSGKDIWVTPVYAVARLIGLNDKVREIWYAVSGLRRGMTPIIKNIRYSPPVTDRDLFYLNQINPIVNFREGFVLWGQLTSRRFTDPLQNLNVMRLLLYCKRALENYCRFFIYELNDAVTWEGIRKAVTDFLGDIRRRRGLYEYNVNVWADEYALLRKIVYVDIILFPTRALERISLNFYVK